MPYKDPAKRREASRRWEKKRPPRDPVKKLAAWRRWRAANPQRAREIQDRHAVKPESRMKKRAADKRWRDANPGYFTKWYRANREKGRALARRYYANRGARTQRLGHLKRTFGISEADYLAMIESQHGLCAICSAPQPGGRNKTWHIDADHSVHPPMIRGLLCAKCNMGIGLLRHDPEILLKASDYLAKPPAQEIKQWPRLLR